MTKILFLLSMLGCIHSLAQTIKGQVLNEAGEPLAFSTIYVKGTTNGTISNEEGYYTLAVGQSNRTLVAQHVGYQKSELSITGDIVNFVLKEQVYTLQNVVVTPGDEDPAYRIIREAIKKRAYHKAQVEGFKCDVYLKGLQRLTKRPERIFGMKVQVDTGIIYLSESISEFAFQQPDKISERLISSKVSGNDNGFSFNRAADFNINAYEKSYLLEGLSERAFISPLSKSSFLYYDFQWLGQFEENGKIVNKIRLLPKRETDPVFSGEIFIVEDDWRIHTVDFLLVKSRGIDFTDSLKIKQVYTPVEEDLWMVSSQQFSFQLKVFGFKGDGYFIGVYTNYEVEKSKDIVHSTVEGQSLQAPLFDEKEFTNEILSVAPQSNKRDSTYWKNVRPIPLTPEEIEDYQIKDSIRLVKESPAYKDSVDRESNQFKLSNALFGYAHSNSKDEQFWQVPSLLSNVQFNTVEGAVLEVSPSFWRQRERRTIYAINPTIRYGFSSEKLYARLNARYNLQDKSFTSYQFSAGKYVSQFDETGAINSLINTYETLADGKNFMKLFEKTFVKAGYDKELINGIFFRGSAEYAKRDTLSNTKLDYYWAPTREVNFTPNLPQNVELTNTGFEEHEAITIDLEFRIRFSQRYASYPDRKFIYPSKYPELTINYRKGFRDINYDFIKLKVADNIGFGILGVSSYSISGGVFLNKKNMTFIDFHHFTSNQTAFSQVGRPLRFELLPFYQYSTGGNYFEAHYEHHFNEFIFNKIPLVKKLNLQAVASLNYLQTRTVDNYLEVGTGIEHIFKFMRIDYWWAFGSSVATKNGIRLGVGF